MVETDLPVPEPADDDVLIRVRTVAVNHQDLFTMSGRAHKANLSFPMSWGSTRRVWWPDTAPGSPPWVSGNGWSSNPP